MFMVIVDVCVAAIQCFNIFSLSTKYWWIGMTLMIWLAGNTCIVVISCTFVWFILMALRLYNDAVQSFP